MQRSEKTEVGLIFPSELWGMLQYYSAVVGHNEGKGEDVMHGSKDEGVGQKDHSWRTEVKGEKAGEWWGGRLGEIGERGRGWKGGAGDSLDHLRASVHEWHTHTYSGPAVSSQHPVREYAHANMQQMKRGTVRALLILLSLSTVQATRKYEWNNWSIKASTGFGSLV